MAGTDVIAFIKMLLFLRKFAFKRFCLYKYYVLLKFVQNIMFKFFFSSASIASYFSGKEIIH